MMAARIHPRLGGLATLAAALAGCAQTIAWSECSSDGDCAGLGGGAGGYCTADRFCVAALPDDRLCPEVVSPPGAGPRLVIASLVDRHDEEDQGMENAFRLAVDEINALQSGAGQPLIELHLCDAGSASDGVQAARAARYAFEQFHVAALLGPTATQDVIAVNPYAVLQGILVMSPSATSTMLTALNDGNLVWRTAPTDAVQAPRLAMLVQNDMPTPIVIDVLYVHNQDGTGLESGFFTAFTAGNQFTVKQALSFSEGAADLAPAIARAAADQPGAFVAIADTDAPAVVAAIAATPDLAAAHVFMTDSAQVTGIFAPDGKAIPPSVLKNIRGTGPAVAKGPTFQIFASSYANRFQKDLQPFAPNAYDAAYAVALAAAATSGHAPTGPELAQGLGRLRKTGTAVPVGPAQYLSAVQQLAAGGVRIAGASGPLEFDGNGDPSSGAFDVWGIDVSGPKPKFVTLAQ